MGLLIVIERIKKIKIIKLEVMIAAFADFLIFWNKYKAKNMVIEIAVAAKPDLDLVKSKAR
jgi:hypothetical protein